MTDSTESKIGVLLMRSLLTAAALALVSSSALANVTLQVTKMAFEVRIESVTATGAASNGMVEVEATAIASNSCMIPTANEVAVQQTRNADQSEYTLVQIGGDRMCPAVFSPTPYKLKFTVQQGAKVNGLSVDSLGNPQGFTCQKGWINCMPIVSEARAKYCTNEYATWAEKNCGGRPQIAH
jgi:hypothetical protein